jgi:hypothetical protein
LLLVSALIVCLPLAARAQVHDNAHIFGPQAVTDAEAAMQRMQDKFGKQFVVETFPAVPDDQKAALQQKGKEAFFKDWKVSRAQALKVNGVYVLICMDPKFIDDGAGRETVAKGIFGNGELSTLRSSFRAALHDAKYDQGLADAVDQVYRAYTANIPGSGGNRTPVERDNATSSRQPTGGGMPAMPGSTSHEGNSSLGIGSLICLAIGALIIFSLVKSIFRHGQPGGGQGGGFGGGGGTGFGGGGAGTYPTGGPSYGPGYGAPPASGGGFGRGFLGGLLGGAVGGYAADKFEHRNDAGPSSWGGDASGGSFGGGGDGGGSFDSGPSDAGQGFGDSGGGSDFGGGGGDSGGSSGGDSGSF